MRAHEVNKVQVPNLFTIGKMAISQPRRGLKSLKPVPGVRATIRNLLSSTTPFGGHKETASLDIVRGISAKVVQYDP